MAADQEADVLAVNGSADLVFVLLDADLRVEVEVLDDPLQDRLDAPGRLVGQVGRGVGALGAHRRLLRFRGGGGGGFEALTSSGVGCSSAGKKSLTTACWPIVQTLVEIQ